MKNNLAFVLSGGGSRGALQVGALYALLEAGLKPDLVIGTSIGSLNAAFLALNGFSGESLDKLKDAWRQATEADLLPTNYLWLTMHAMFRHSPNDPSQRLKDFIISRGVTPEITFSAFQSPRLVIVSSDLNSGKPVLHGEEPDDQVLDAVLLSTALPPWFMPVKKQGRYEMDGGVVSNLPIEPALKCGASHIVALDLMDGRELPEAGNRLAGFFTKLSSAVEKRQVDLELELAEARSIPVLYINLTSDEPVAMWDFRHTDEMITKGYEIARQTIADHPNLRAFIPGAFRSWLKRKNK